jgi:hypothetical protein
MSGAMSAIGTKRTSESDVAGRSADIPQACGDS